MKRHSRGGVSAEPEVGMVIAKTTTQHPVNSTCTNSKTKKKGPNSDSYYPFPHILRISNKIQVPAVSYTVVPSLTTTKKICLYALLTLGQYFHSQRQIWHDSVIALTQKCLNTPTEHFLKIKSVHHIILTVYYEVPPQRRRGQPGKCASTIFKNCSILSCWLTNTQSITKSPPITKKS